MQSGHVPAVGYSKKRRAHSTRGFGPTYPPAGHRISELGAQSWPRVGRDAWRPPPVAVEPDGSSVLLTFSLVANGMNPRRRQDLVVPVSNPSVLLANHERGEGRLPVAVAAVQDIG